MMYLLIVIARMLNKDTATNPYRNSGNSLHRRSPCIHFRFQKVLEDNGKLKQQNNKSEQDKFMMNTAVAFLSWNELKLNKTTSYNNNNNNNTLSWTTESKDSLFYIWRVLLL